jgi:hypothetical protein
MPELPDGLYPFIDERLPLTELVMVEAPDDLEALFKSEAVANGIEIIETRPSSFDVALPNIQMRRFSFSGRMAPTAFTCLYPKNSSRAAPDRYRANPIRPQSRPA